MECLFGLMPLDFHFRMHKKCGLIALWFTLNDSILLSMPLLSMHSKTKPDLIERFEINIWVS